MRMTIKQGALALTVLSSAALFEGPPSPIRSMTKAISEAAIGSSGPAGPSVTIICATTSSAPMMRHVRSTHTGMVRRGAMTTMAQPSLTDPLLQSTSAWRWEKFFVMRRW